MTLQNHSNKLICSSKTIVLIIYLLIKKLIKKKTFCCLWKKISWNKKKSLKRTAFICCNEAKYFSVTFDQIHACLLNERQKYGTIYYWIFHWRSQSLWMGHNCSLPPKNRSSLETSTPLLPLKLGFVSTFCGNVTFLAEASTFIGRWWRLVTTAALRAMQHCSNAYMIN